jgi:glucose-6-phosphate isomerase
MITSQPPPPTELAAWQDLRRHHARLSDRHLRDLFDSDPDRAHRMTVEAVGMTADFSKHLIDDQVLASLIDLARQAGLSERIEAMFTGAHINVSEDRAVLHTALRLPPGSKLVVDGVDVAAEVHETLDRMAAFADRVRSGEWKGADGRSIRNIINIGIGGSDLGPVMAHEALLPYGRRDFRVRFVSNVDRTALYEATRDLDPGETLFIVASKTFGTLETMTNASAARKWIIDALGEDSVARHFVAVSTNAERVKTFGIDLDHMFGFWDWVGGRYSMDSAIGLSTMISIGPDHFRQMLAGFHAMDEHFRSAPLDRNLPVLMGLLAVWYRNFFGVQSVAVIPYAQYLHRFPAYLQQLTMESNGKQVTATGSPVAWDTGPVYWGEPGTNGQHSFFQLLHQGTTAIPVDLIGFAMSPADERQDLLAANLLAQARALAFGKTPEEVEKEGTPTEVVPHRVMPGNRPTTVILSKKLDPYRLGTLVALYEHSVFTQGTVWGIDSFDQWGVELGKTLAVQIAPMLAGEQKPTYDPSTNGLIERYLALQKETS